MDMIKVAIDIVAVTQASPIETILFIIVYGNILLSRWWELEYTIALCKPWILEGIMYLFSSSYLFYA